MKTIFATLVLFAFAFVAYAENDGTVSVLNTAATTQAAPTPATTQATAPAATTVAATTNTVACTACVEEARAVKLSPFTVRRLNRVADRQEAREARKCCCCNCKDSCACAQDCCKAPKALVVESRRKCNCCR